MGVFKLNPHDFSKLRRPNKTLSIFWKSYFEKLSMEMTKAMFLSFKSHCNVSMVNREVVYYSDYVAETDANSLIQMFKVYPHGSIGFYNIPADTVQVIINELMGGHKYNQNAQQSYNPRNVSHMDESIVATVVEKLFNILQIPFQNDNRMIEFEMLESSQANILMQNIHDHELVSTQQFMIEINNENYYFDLVLSNQFLENFVSL